MRICPVCKAEVSDFESKCEYCGTEIPLNSECSAILKNAEFVFSKSDEILNKKKIKAKEIKESIKSISIIEDSLINFAESEKILKLLSDLKKRKEMLEQKLVPIKKQERLKKILLTIILSIIAEIALFVIFLLVDIYGKSSVEKVVYGIVGIVFIILGMGISKDLWTGFFGGLIVAAIIGALFTWLVASVTGQIALIFIWTISIIVFDVITLRKKD